MKMEKQICSSKLATPIISSSMHKSSQTISKSKPKIRIIHIFAPEIIKTDAENFRELVQRLTGKPTDDNDKKPKPRKNDHKIFSSNKIKKTFHAEFRERIKGEEEIWNGANSGAGFLGSFAHDQFDQYGGFMPDRFPFLEGTTHDDDQMDAAGYGESIGTIC